MTKIPEAAVLAAAKASWENSNSDPWDANDTIDLRWDDRQIYLNDAKVMLEAAVPHMLAEAKADAWQEGMSYALPGTPRGIETFDSLKKSNPYGNPV